MEASWSYRHPPRVGRDKLADVAAAPEAVRVIAWKAQTRLSARYRARFVGFDRTGAEQACLALKGRGQDCMVLKAP